MGVVVLITDPDGNEHRAEDRAAFHALLARLRERFGQDAEFELRAEGPAVDGQERGAAA